MIRRPPSSTLSSSSAASDVYKRQLKEVVNLFVPNMEWQGDYFRDFDIPVAPVVYEPIDTDFFRPLEKKKVILAGGAICHEKNIPFFIELFAKLGEMDTGDYKTAYVGGASLWNEVSPQNMKLERQLKAVTDIFHGIQPANKVATITGEAALAVLNPYYETCNRFDMELMSAGVARVCGPHICYDERPASRRFTTIDECIEALARITTDWTTLPLKTHETEARQYAVDMFSFDATLKQLDEVLKYLL